MKGFIQILRLALKLGLGFVLMGTLLPIAASAQASSVDLAKERQVRAAILFNLARFSEWPEHRFTGPESEFNICVDSNAKMLEAFHALRRKNIQGRPVRVLDAANKRADIKSCHVLYITDPRINVPDLSVYSSHNILTVGSGSRFLKSGGNISIERIGTKVGFAINKTTMLEADISPSSKILKLAREVH